MPSRAWAPPLVAAIFMAVACFVVISTHTERDAVLEEAVEMVYAPQANGHLSTEEARKLVLNTEDTNFLESTMSELTYHTPFAMEQEAMPPMLVSRSAQAEPQPVVVNQAQQQQKESLAETEEGSLDYGYGGHKKKKKPTVSDGEVDNMMHEAHQAEHRARIAAKSEKIVEDKVKGFPDVVKKAAASAAAKSAATTQAAADVITQSKIADEIKRMQEAQDRTAQYKAATAAALKAAKQDKMLAKKALTQAAKMVPAEPMVPMPVQPAPVQPATQSAATGSAEQAAATAAAAEQAPPPAAQPAAPAKPLAQVDPAVAAVAAHEAAQQPAEELVEEESPSRDCSHDKRDGCKQWAHNCKHGDWEWYMKHYCAKTCQYPCHGGAATVVSGRASQAVLTADPASGPLDPAEADLKHVSKHVESIADKASDDDSKGAEFKRAVKGASRDIDHLASQQHQAVAKYWKHVSASAEDVAAAEAENAERTPKPNVRDDLESKAQVQMAKADAAMNKVERFLHSQDDVLPPHASAAQAEQAITSAAGTMVPPTMVQPSEAVVQPTAAAVQASTEERHSAAVPPPSLIGVSTLNATNGSKLTWLSHQPPRGPRHSHTHIHDDDDEPETAPHSAAAVGSAEGSAAVPQPAVPGEDVYEKYTHAASQQQKAVDHAQEEMDAARAQADAAHGIPEITADKATTVPPPAPMPLDTGVSDVANVTTAAPSPSDKLAKAESVAASEQDALDKALHALSSAFGEPDPTPSPLKFDPASIADRMSSEAAKKNVSIAEGAKGTLGSTAAETHAAVLAKKAKAARDRVAAAQKQLQEAKKAAAAFNNSTNPPAAPAPQQQVIPPSVPVVPPAGTVAPPPLEYPAIHRDPVMSPGAHTLAAPPMGSADPRPMEAAGSPPQVPPPEAQRAPYYVPPPVGQISEPPLVVTMTPTPSPTPPTPAPTLPKVNGHFDVPDKHFDDDVAHWEDAHYNAAAYGKGSGTVDWGNNQATPPWTSGTKAPWKGGGAGSAGVLTATNKQEPKVKEAKEKKQAQEARSKFAVPEVLMDHVEVPPQVDTSTLVAPPAMLLEDSPTAEAVAQEAASQAKASAAAKHLEEAQGLVHHAMQLKNDAEVKEGQAAKIEADAKAAQAANAAASQQSDADDAVTPLPTDYDKLVPESAATPQPEGQKWKVVERAVKHAKKLIDDDHWDDVVSYAEDKAPALPEQAQLKQTAERRVKAVAEAKLQLKSEAGEAADYGTISHDLQINGKPLVHGLHGVNRVVKLKRELVRREAQANAALRTIDNKAESALHYGIEQEEAKERRHKSMVANHAVSQANENREKATEMSQKMAADRAAMDIRSDKQAKAAKEAAQKSKALAKAQAAALQNQKASEKAHEAASKAAELEDRARTMEAKEKQAERDKPLKLSLPAPKRPDQMPLDTPRAKHPEPKPPSKTLEDQQAALKAAADGGPPPWEAGAGSGKLIPDRVAVAMQLFEKAGSLQGSQYKEPQPHKAAPEVSFDQFMQETAVGN